MMPTDPEQDNIAGARGILYAVGISLAIYLLAFAVVLWATWAPAGPVQVASHMEARP